jgi:hypothetical protein
MPPRLDQDIERLELTMEGLLKLLGGSRDDRERFWEIVKGITTPAEFRLAQSAIDAVNQQLATAHATLAATHAAAGEIRAQAG